MRSLNPSDIGNGSQSFNLNILIAYPYLRGRALSILNELSREKNFKLLIDSGAFTAWKAGKSILLDDYCRFLETLPFIPWKYFTLDIVGDPGGSLANYQTMLRRGFNPIPVFTRGEDPSVLEEYYASSDVVGVGGLVQNQGAGGFVKGIMKHIGRRNVHWLGFTPIEFIRAYRPFSCDSTSWSSGLRFGVIPIYLGHGKFTSIQRKDFTPERERVARAPRKIWREARRLPKP